MDYCENLHASAFVYDGMGCLVLGESGTGKSRLMVEAIKLGARMIADDQVRLCVMQGHIVASAVPQLEGIIELRGFGLVRRADVVHSHPIHLVVQLDPKADGRLPDKNEFYAFKDTQTPLRTVPPPPTLSSSTVLLYLKAMQEGRTLPPDWKPAA